MIPGINTMVRKTQDTRKRLLLADPKYEPSKLCELCGRPTGTVATKCLTCTDALYVVEELTFARALLRDHPGKLIQLAHDKHKLVHLVLFRSPKLAWCGAKVTQALAKRDTAKPGMFPPGICVQCFTAYEGVEL